MSNRESARASRDRAVAPSTSFLCAGYRYSPGSRGEPVPAGLKCCLGAVSAAVGERSVQVPEESVDQHAVRIVAPDPSHVFFEVENVVGQTERYWVVEKIGTARAVAESTSEELPEGAPAQHELESSVE
jgi:hypothetical protein